MMASSLPSIRGASSEVWMSQLWEAAGQLTRVTSLPTAAKPTSVLLVRAQSILWICTFFQASSQLLQSGSCNRDLRTGPGH